MGLQTVLLLPCSLWANLMDLLNFLHMYFLFHSYASTESANLGCVEHSENLNMFAETHQNLGWWHCAQSVLAVVMCEWKSQCWVGCPEAGGAVPAWPAVSGDLQWLGWQLAGSTAMGRCGDGSVHLPMAMGLLQFWGSYLFQSSGFTVPHRSLFLPPFALILAESGC